MLYGGNSAFILLLTVGELGGDGTIDNLTVNEILVTNKTHKMYSEDAGIFAKIFGFLSFVFSLISGLV